MVYTSFRLTLTDIYIRYSQVVFLRKASLSVFAPVADLSAISRSGVEARNSVERKKEVARMGGGGGVTVLGDEWADHVVKVRKLLLEQRASAID